MTATLKVLWWPRWHKAHPITPTLATEEKQPAPEPKQEEPKAPAPVPENASRD
jgi:hypothetical protein